MGTVSALSVLTRVERTSMLKKKKMYVCILAVDTSISTQILHMQST